MLTEYSTHSIGMRSNIVSILNRRNANTGIVLDCFSNGIKSILVIVFVEETEETPHARSGSIVVLGFDIHGTFLDLRTSSGCFPQVSF